MYLVTAEEMREMDHQTIESFGVPGRVLMENAGRGAVKVLKECFPDIGSRCVGILAGKGNNGGDGFVIARYLSFAGAKVNVFLVGKQSDVKGDAGANLALLKSLDVVVTEISDSQAFKKKKPAMRRQDMWVDALLGTGLSSDVRGYFRDVIEFVNRLAKPVLAVDIPSGLNSDNGQICGACIQARVTVTFAFAKIGHMTFPGAELSGDLHIVDIGIPPFIADRVAPQQVLLNPDRIKKSMGSRPPDAHKGSTGHLLALCGSSGKSGAAAMTALSAMRAGAGLVTLGVPESLNSVLEPQATEVMTFPLPETKEGFLDSSALESVATLLDGKRCVAIGPGIGTAPQTGDLVRGVLSHARVPLVIDADGINLLADSTDAFKGFRPPVILTPHPGEMARLLHTTPREVQQDRVGCARDFARTYGVHAVLKGAATVVAHPDGMVFINPTGNSGMASGGMGDVLTGLIAGFLTQGYGPEAATHTGVYLHGMAADHLFKHKGPFGYLATEVMNRIPEEIRMIAE